MLQVACFNRVGTTFIDVGCVFFQTAANVFRYMFLFQFILFAPLSCIVTHCSGQCHCVPQILAFA